MGFRFSLKRENIEKEPEVVETVESKEKYLQKLEAERQRIENESEELKRVKEMEKAKPKLLDDFVEYAQSWGSDTLKKMMEDSRKAIEDIGTKHYADFEERLEEIKKGLAKEHLDLHLPPKDREVINELDKKITKEKEEIKWLKETSKTQ